MHGSDFKIGFSANLSQVVKLLKTDRNPQTLCPQGRKAINKFCEEAKKVGVCAGETIYLTHPNLNWHPYIKETLTQLYGNGRKDLGGFIKFCLSDKRLGKKGIKNPHFLVLDKKGLKEINKILIA